MPAIRIAVAGAQGHMGRALLAAVAAAPAFSLVGGFGRPEKVVDGLIDVDAALRAADVVVDFTTGQASAALAEKCAAMGRPAMVIGATGFEDTHLARIAAPLPWCIDAPLVTIRANVRRARRPSPGRSVCTW
ncbi:hypothetical protein [Mesorhizobium sp.]|uniref:hypothetical protein n=1 Tax=Mesorhizobium sp. TaxID=1871066 RepID=UPI00257FDAB3|nr:hypothetical protein [Mesorhizobium sp.]